MRFSRARLADQTLLAGIGEEGMEGGLAIAIVGPPTLTVNPPSIEVMERGPRGLSHTR